jgi:hypothetical protein
MSKRKFGQLLQVGANKTSEEEHKPPRKLSGRYKHTYAKENDVHEVSAAPGSGQVTSTSVTTVRAKRVP